jgi:DNA-binding transcriptional LysR family regulator
VKLHSDLRELFALLASREVDFVIVGGHAVAFHGFPRFTGDVDLFVRPSPENAARILASLAEFGFGDTGLTASDLTEPDTVVQLGRAPNRVDLLTSLTGVSFDEAWAARVPGTLDDLPVWFISKELLVRNKSALRRPMDLADVSKLQEP